MAAKFTSNLDQVMSATDRAMRKAAEIIGGTAEGFAKRRCLHDTGLLRNSITHGLAGEAPSTGAYTDDAGAQRGQYTGDIPKASGSKYTVVIGTNVHYATYIEMGTVKMDPHPYMRPAIEEHRDEYRQVVETCLKNA